MGDTRRVRVGNLRLHRDLPQSPAPSLDAHHDVSDRFRTRRTPTTAPSVQWVASTNPWTGHSLQRSRGGSCWRTGWCRAVHLARGRWPRGPACGPDRWWPPPADRERRSPKGRTSCRPSRRAP